MKGEKKDPRKAQQECDAVQDAKRGKRGLSLGVIHPIEPEHLRQPNEKNGAVTGMEQSREAERDGKQVSLLRRLQMPHKEIDTNH